MICCFLRPVSLLLLGAMVASCSSTAQLAQRDSERCAARGLKPGTDAFSDCVLQMETERKVRADSRYRDMVVERTAVPPYR
jgi:hypothetical protein